MIFQTGLVLLSAFSGIQKAKAEKKAGEEDQRSRYLDAIEVGIQRKQAEIQAQRSHNFRLQEYELARRSNVSFDGFRNVSGASVERVIIQEKGESATFPGQLIR